MSGFASVEVTLPAEPRTVGVARRAVRDALNMAGATHLSDLAELVASELVTNAVVHAGTHVRLSVAVVTDAIRVEVEDGSSHLPIRRTWAEMAGTGRGLRIVDEHADRWGAVRTGNGKVVWFEIGQPSEPFPVGRSSLPELAPEPERIEITLLAVPLLMHWAWQEHAATLLREYLLYALAQDTRALDDHAAASSALSLLDECLPTPRLPEEPDALMASSVEPIVTADRVSLRVPAIAVQHFEILDDLLVRAVAAAQDGRLLCPPTQPEMAEVRAWLCGEVARQVGAAPPTPWQPGTDVRAALDPDSMLARAYRQLSESDEPIIVTDDTSVIVAVTWRVVEFLGYDREADLLGRRILAVVPTRFHQAHIAGTTLHVTNGRDALLNQWINVPIVRADGTEVHVGLHVAPHRLDGDLRVFVAHLRV